MPTVLIYCAVTVSITVPPQLIDDKTYDAKIAFDRIRVIQTIGWDQSSRKHIVGRFSLVNCANTADSRSVVHTVSISSKSPK